MAVFDIKTELTVQYESSPGTWVTMQADTVSVEIDRGITVEQGVFARPDVGTATIVLQKSNLSDLLGTPGYKSNMAIQVMARSQSLFYGLIQNIAIQYMAETKQIQITIQANDFTKVFMNTTLGTFTIPAGSHSTRGYRTCMSLLNTAVQAVDSRMSLTQYGSTASGTTQPAYTWYDTQAGTILNQFLDAELGWCFTQTAGTNMFYMTRGDVDALQATTWSSGRRTISNVHSTATNHVCMNAIDMSYNSDGICNVATVTDLNLLNTVTSTNSTSTSAYGRQNQKFEINADFSSGAVSTLTSWAQQVSAAANPKSIKSVSCPAIRRDGDLSSIVQAEIADVQQVEFAATGYTTLQEIYLITRVKHSITVDHWDVTLDLWRGI